MSSEDKYTCIWTFEQMIEVLDGKLCDTLFDLVAEKDKDELSKILYEGKIGDYGLHTEKFSITHDNPYIEARRRISMAYLFLNDRETYEYFKQNDIILFHGTNANALPGIAKNGLLSGANIEGNGDKVLSGEWYTRGRRQRSFISFTDVLDIAEDYACMDKNFPVLVCTSPGALIYNNVKQVPVMSDVSEFGFDGIVPIEAIKCICVPKDKIDYVKKIINNPNIKILGISNLDIKFYEGSYVVNFSQNRYNEYIQRRFDAKKEIISEEELEQNAKSRCLSRIKSIFDWLINGKEVKRDEYSR